jgi:hypothetical protein
VTQSEVLTLRHDLEGGGLALDETALASDL